MPRVTPSRNKNGTIAERTKPYSSRAKTSATTAETKTSKQQSSKGKSGKDSHLYTDDNPSTTLHGTGFKDAATAEHTIELVSQRSLLYQFQTINTMYHRAAHHPSSKTNVNIQGAMNVFRKWLDETYPAAREAQREYPLLKKDVVEKLLSKIEGNLEESDTEWAKIYVALPKGKRLANVLMDDNKPEERDLAVVRRNFLDSIIEQEWGKEIPSKQDEMLWDGTRLSSLHLKLIAYGFSPVGTTELLKRSKE